MYSQLQQGDTRNILDWTLGENKPNSKPILGKGKRKKAKMRVNSVFIRVHPMRYVKPLSHRVNSWLI
jgi:hypothetical protein